MTRYLTSAMLVGTLAVPAVAFAQHQQGGAPSSGTATSSGGSSSSSGGSSSSSGGSTSSSGGGATTSTFSAGSPSSSSGGRQRGNQPATGRAMPRSAGANGGGTIIIENSGFYPWGYAYGAGAFGGGYYGGYYGAYDPWYGFFPTYAPSTYAGDNSGAVRLKVTPSDASVYVDGFYVGVVDDFDGAFQRLKLDPGPHRLEMREQNYRPLSVDVMIQEDFTITYRGELTKQ